MAMVKQLSVYNSHQHNDNRDNQQDVNETPHGVRGNQSQNPQDEHYNSNGIEHNISTFIIGLRNNWQETGSTVAGLFLNCIGSISGNHNFRKSKNKSNHHAVDLFLVLDFCLVHTAILGIARHRLTFFFCYCVIGIDSVSCGLLMRNPAFFFGI